MLIFPECPIMIQGALTLLAGISRCSQAFYPHSSTCRQCSQVFPCPPTGLFGTPSSFQTYLNHTHGTLVPVIRDSSYSEGWQKCAPRVRYSPQIDQSMFTLHIISDTLEGSQWLKYNLLMYWSANNSNSRDIGVEEIYYNGSCCGRGSSGWGCSGWGCSG